MRRKDVKKMLPIIQGYAEGKTIQWYKPISDEWVDIIGGDNINLEGLTQYECAYRIKPEPELEPKYRPFKNAEECWHEMLKHTPFGWVKCKDGSTINKFMFICNISDKDATFNNCIEFTYDDFLEDYVFTDGTPFGVKIEEK